MTFTLVVKFKSQWSYTFFLRSLGIYLCSVKGIKNGKKLATLYRLSNIKFFKMKEQK